MTTETTIARISTTMLEYDTAVPTESGRIIESITSPYAHNPAPTAEHTASRRTCSETTASGRPRVPDTPDVLGDGVSSRGSTSLDSAIGLMMRFTRREAARLAAGALRGSARSNGSSAGARP